MNFVIPMPGQTTHLFSKTNENTFSSRCCILLEVTDHLLVEEMDSFVLCDFHVSVIFFIPLQSFEHEQMNVLQTSFLDTFPFQSVVYFFVIFYAMRAVSGLPQHYKTFLRISATFHSLKKLSSLWCTFDPWKKENSLTVARQNWPELWFRVIESLWKLNRQEYTTHCAFPSNAWAEQRPPRWSYCFRSKAIACCTASFGQKPLVKFSWLPPKLIFTSPSIIIAFFPAWSGTIYGPKNLEVKRGLRASFRFFDEITCQQWVRMIHKTCCWFVIFQEGFLSFREAVWYFTESNIFACCRPVGCGNA